jgi:CheY-like chemotaxis protein
MRAAKTHMPPRNRKPSEQKSKQSAPPAAPAGPTLPSSGAPMDGFSDDYLSIVAHDLRGSLNSIIGWAELIKRKALPEDGNVRAGETIIRQARQQLELINEVVDTWRLLSGNLQLKFAPIDARELVQQALSAARESTKKAITFDLSLEPLSGPLYADGVRIRQVLIALFNSAIHFVPTGGTVSVTLKPAENRTAELSIRDSGAGVDAAALPYLFSRQRQTDPVKNSARAKFGRGLGLVRDIVDLHGGTIKAETEGEGGVTFRLRLPMAPVPSAVHVAKVREIESSSPPDVHSRLAGTVVLIVDDDPDAREVVGAILRHFGAKVVVATSVSTAMVALRKEQQLDVLIADLGMPVEDGYDLIRQVRESSIAKIAAMPAAALTAYTTEEDRERVLAAGFQFHLAKPVDPAVLVATVERLRKSDHQSIH